MNTTGKGYVKRQFLFVLAILSLAIILFIIGLMIGYGVIGDGDSIWAILSPSKWAELIDKFKG